MTLIIRKLEKAYEILQILACKDQTSRTLSDVISTTPASDNRLLIASCEAGATERVASVTKYVWNPCLAPSAAVDPTQ